MYASGKGVPQDQAQALAWYDKAAANGSARAKTTLSKLRPLTQSASAPAHEPVK
jgi:TPR repeat protein